MKATIITMRLFGLQFDQIEARIGVGEPTCHRIYHRAIKDASNEDLHDMADSLSTKKHLGRERKIKNGSKLSKVIRQDIPVWEDFSFEEAAARLSMLQA
jgi:hypothetical protein